jgi:hypothetical protein
MLGVFGGLPLKHYDRKRDDDLTAIFEREGSKFADEVFGAGRIPEPTIPHTDQRCKVCEFRMTCRGEQIDQTEVAELKAVAKAKKTLVQIDSAPLAATLNDIDFLKAERKALDASIEIAERRALDALGETEAALVRGYGKAYRMESQANYLDAQRIKAEEPETYKKYFVSRKTGDRYLRLYPEKLA